MPGHAFFEQAVVERQLGDDLLQVLCLAPQGLDLIRNAGARLFFLPPYSPDLNPIEQVFAKLKKHLRRAEERTIESTWKRIGALLDQFEPQECANYIRNAGYASN
jgi:transposase